MEAERSVGTEGPGERFMRWLRSDLGGEEGISQERARAKTGRGHY